MNMIKVIYALTIAAFLIMSVAFGISAFYEPPERPEYNPSPAIVKPVPAPEGTPIASATPADKLLPPSKEYYESEEYRQYEDEYHQRLDAYEENMRHHRRTIFFIAYPLGLVFVILGLELKLRLNVLKPGLTLGGLGTITYAISQPDLSDEVRFIGVAIGLIVLVYVGYRTLAERKNQ